MHREVMSRAEQMDVVVMAAAVADYTPERNEPHKVEKQPGPLTLALTRTPDILADLGAARAARSSMRPVLVGFAAETQDVIGRARRKRERKQADLIVANDVLQEGAGLEVDTNIVTLVGADGDEQHPRQPKREVARLILDRVDRLLSKRGQI
jgi:phosphopantothenoylcysteine decarboxylase/phosphopantothenate--cysteine ligase